MKEHLKNLIQKQSEGKLSLKEKIELSEQLADSNNQAAEQLITEEWQAQLESGEKSLPCPSGLLDRIHHQIRLNEDNSSIKLKWWITFQRIAAILIFPLLLSFVGYLYMQQDQTAQSNSFAQIQCPLGVRTKFQLPDGSTGYLNSGSSLKYNVSFDSDRKVELTGEAYFDVVHNEKLPFHVNTKNMDIKVLGTTFNVIANEGEQTEEVVLQTGKVDVLSKSGDKLATITPNELLTLNIEKRTFSKKGVEATQYTTWKDGRLVFRNENMQQLAKRLSRWYNAEVIVDDRMLDDYTFHATFADEPLDEVLKLLSLTTPFSYREDVRVSNANGIFEKRKIMIRIDKTKINRFK